MSTKADPIPIIGISADISSIGIDLFGGKRGQCRIVYSRRCSHDLYCMWPALARWAAMSC